MKKTFIFLSLFVLLQSLKAQRNTLLIIADDIGTDYFGFNEDHQDTVAVPHLRALLSRGVRFKNAMSNPVCSSTRAGILTGRYSFRTGVGNIVGSLAGSGQIDTSELTIPRLLRSYNTNIARANIGKWHLNQPTPASNLLNPLVLGYEHFEGPFIGQLPSYINWTKYTNGITSTVTTYATSENVNNAVTWLKAQNNKPFFLWLAFNSPHEPLHLPPAGLHTYTTLTGTTANINANPKSYFKAMIQAMDSEIGRLLDSLQAINRLDSTDIIFIGDNGNTPKTAQIANTNRAKATIYQYGVHVPFLISGPSVVNPGRVSDALVNSVDILATVLELFGYTNWQSQIPSNKPVDSKSLLPILKNQSTSVRPWSFCELFKVTTDSSDGKAMRNMDYKLIRFNNGNEKFFSLLNDPGEQVNLLATIMNSVDITNYYYLCNELTALVNSGNFCTNGVGVKENELSNKEIGEYPNPFTSHIYIEGGAGKNHFELTNLLGQIIYSGNEIDKQDFSNLPKGVYLLKDVNNSTRTLKLIKE